jgi:hypothetical protein
MLSYLNKRIFVFPRKNTELATKGQLIGSRVKRGIGMSGTSKLTRGEALRSSSAAFRYSTFDLGCFFYVGEERCHLKARMPLSKAN